MNLFGKNRIFSFFKSDSPVPEKQVSKTGQSSNSNNYSISRNEYYIERLYPRTILGFDKLFSKNVNLQLATAKLIEPKEFSLNAAYSDIIAIHGNPRMEIQQDAFFKTIFYKRTNKNGRVLTQLHFLNNSLFYFSTSFSDLSSKEKVQLTDALQNKYNIIGLKNNSVIIDRDGNKITIEDDVYTRISYLTGNQALLEALKNKCLALSVQNSAVNNPFNDFI